MGRCDGEYAVKYLALQRDKKAADWILGGLLACREGEDAEQGADEIRRILQVQSVTLIPVLRGGCLIWANRCRLSHDFCRACLMKGVALPRTESCNRRPASKPPFWSCWS